MGFRYGWGVGFRLGKNVSELGVQRMKTPGHADKYSCEDHFHLQTMIRHARQIVDDFSYTISYQSQRMIANACKTVEERWNLLKQTSPAFQRVRLEIVLAESIFSGTKTKFILEKNERKHIFLYSSGRPLDALQCRLSVGNLVLVSGLLTWK